MSRRGSDDGGATPKVTKTSFGREKRHQTARDLTSQAAGVALQFQSDLTGEGRGLHWKQASHSAGRIVAYLADGMVQKYYTYYGTTPHYIHEKLSQGQGMTCK